MSDICFCNCEPDPDKEYFLYIGELKNYYINTYLAETLSRIHNREFGFISIVPDVLEQYLCENLVVINPLTECLTDRYGFPANCRISSKDFMTCVSNNQYVKDLVNKLVEKQGNLFIYMYESRPEMTLDHISGVSVLGPSSRAAARLNSKIFQYRHCGDFVILPEFRLCHGLDDLCSITDGLWDKWKDGIFVTEEFSAAGVNSIVAMKWEDISKRFSDPEDTYLVSRYIPHEHDPTVLGVVANEDEVYIAGVADQRIVDYNRFTGSTYPSVLPPETVDSLKVQTRRVGKWLASEGYRGIFGCDYLLDQHGDLIFLEVNARKQGTTMEFCCTLEQTLPKGSPMLPELEYNAVMHGKFPGNTVEMTENSKNIHWGTYNYKLSRMVCTTSYIPHSSQERGAFQRVAGNSLKKEFLILEHVGSDFVVAEGAFLGRIVALGRDHKSVRQGLTQGRKTLELTIGDCWEEDR